MKETKRTYEREFKLEALRLLEASGESAAQIERDLGITPGLLSRWKRQMAARDEQAFPGRGRLTPDQEHVRQLERENELLRQERDILHMPWRAVPGKKAVATALPSRAQASEISVRRGSSRNVSSCANVSSTECITQRVLCLAGSPRQQAGDGQSIAA